MFGRFFDLAARALPAAVMLRTAEPVAFRKSLRFSFECICCYLHLFFKGHSAIDLDYWVKRTIV